jgi:branched-chain amino acid transport system permease protein
VLSVIVIGVVYGCIYALAASGVVVTYQTSGVFNFGHGAIGMLAAWTYWQFALGWGWPAPIALIIVLFVLAPIFGAIIERVLIRPLHGASVDITVVVTLCLLLGLIGTAQLVWNQQRIYRNPSFFPGLSLDVFGFRMNGNQILVIVAAVAVALGLRLFFNRTRIGIAMRGVVDNPDLVAMAGGVPTRVQQLAWALGCSLASLAGILLAANESLTVGQLALLVTLGYAAAMVGQLRSLPLTVLGGLLLGLAGSFVNTYLNYTWLSGFRLILPMVVLFGALIVLSFIGKERLRAGTVIGPRAPSPASLRSSLVWGAVLVAVAVALAGHLSPSSLFVLSKGWAIAFILLSLVLLTGYAGLTSLCQMTFAGFGGFAMGRLGHGGSLWGVLAAVGLAAGVGLIVGLVTVRLRGLYLALATFAFATAMDEIFFKSPHIFGGGGTLNVERPHIPGFRQTDRIFFIELAVCFVVASIGVLALRRGPLGRRLSALDDSPAACATLGLNIAWTRLALITVSAGLAGLGGVFYGGAQGLISADDFAALVSLLVLLQLRIGGISTASGAFFGAMFFALFQLAGAHHLAVTVFGHRFEVLTLQYVLVALGALAVTRDPNGIGGHIATAGEQLRAMLADRKKAPPGSTPPSTQITEPATELAHV